MTQPIVTPRIAAIVTIALQSFADRSDHISLASQIGAIASQFQSLESQIESHSLERSHLN
ncbi:hypothetical protein AAEJ74_24920 [Limnospira fusiformis PMC 851.14]|uniref:Uncharacterized protein n=1 Tax=Limnospira fusiformis PMC 851.14 TaxID=2219512 RepID=A0ABU9ETN7_LIMFS